MTEWEEWEKDIFLYLSFWVGHEHPDVLRGRCVVTVVVEVLVIIGYEFI